MLKQMKCFIVSIAVIIGFLMPQTTLAATSDVVDWNDSNRYVMITTEPPEGEAPKILAYTTPQGITVEEGSAFKINVTTNGAALWVWVEGRGGEAWQGKLVNTGNEDGKPKWEVTCYPLDGRLKIIASSGPDTQVTIENLSVTLTDTKTSTSDSEPQILGITTTSGTRISKDSNFMANITTNGAALSVWAETSDGEKWQGKVVDTGNEDGMPKWEITGSPLASGQIKICARGSSAKTAMEILEIAIIE